MGEERQSSQSLNRLPEEEKRKAERRLDGDFGGSSIKVEVHLKDREFEAGDAPGEDLRAFVELVFLGVAGL